MLNIPIKKLNPRAQLPVYGSQLAAGADLRACVEGPVEVRPGETVLIPTGLAMALPEGYVGLICARSGLSVKRGLAPANKVGVIDADYRGELLVALYNHGRVVQSIMDGERIAQLLVVPVPAAAFCETDFLPETERGSGGFGSTGSM